MNKYIVTTTINPPTLATIKYARKEDWTLIVVGDTKTPHQEYENLNCVYLSPEYQEKTYPELSAAIGWKSIQRRNIGFVEAYNRGADIIATVDDDNIPHENWGKDVLVNQLVEIDFYETDLGVFDPLSVTEHNEVWHRGYPIELVPLRKNVRYGGKLKRTVLVQADLWDGDPDIDAMARLSIKPTVKFNVPGPYGSTSISPFNSQNTFLSREVIPYYAVFPYVGRMDDIWGGYILQHYFPNSVIYNKASVYQDRNVQDLVTNLENEIIGYRNTFNLVANLVNYKEYLPEKAQQFYEIYQSCFN